MPRGVYDRSSKTKSAATKTEAPKAEKKVRAPYGSKKAAKYVSTDTRDAAPAAGKSDGPSLAELASIRAAFSGAQPNTAILSKIDTLALRILGSLVDDGGNKPEADPKSEAGITPMTKVPQAVAPVQAVAPIQAAAPFNPVVPNGQA